MNPPSYRILLIEDSPDDALLVTTMLSRNQAIRSEVVHEDRVSSARARLHQEAFDCVLLDLGLPDARGLEAVRLITAAAQDAAIVVLTGLEDEDTGLEALKEGAQDYLSKNQVDGNVLGRSIRYSVERKRVEATKRHFLDNAAHELRTPLSIISGAAEILDLHKDDIDRSRFDELVSVIAKQGRRVSYLLTQLLELSELQDTPREGIEVVDIAAFVAEALQGTPPPEDKVVEELVEEGVKGRAHPDRLLHVLAHLLENAYRYGGSNISVEARTVDEVTILAVADDGPGISEELRSQLFEPFGRGSLWHPQGTGLGLAICQRMARSFDAQLVYRPRRPHGARFELVLTSA